MLPLRDFETVRVPDGVTVKECEWVRVGDLDVVGLGVAVDETVPLPEPLAELDVVWLALGVGEGV